MIKVRIKEVDLGWDKLQADLKKIEELQAETGYTQSGGDFGMAGLAAVHEFGANIPVTEKMRKYLASQGLFLKADTKVIKIPERPFMRESFDRNIDTITKAGYALADKVLIGKIGPELAYEIWGDSYKSELQKGVITKGLNLKKNHPFTVERKGSDTPLVDKGRLISGIETKVVEK